MRARDVKRGARRARCSIVGCGDLVEARGWCNKHYTRWRVRGSTTTLLRHANGSVVRCSVSTCESGPPYVRELCDKHYHRLRQTGTVDRVTINNVGLVCEHIDCDRGAVNRGMCSTHSAYRWARDNPDRHKAIQSRGQRRRYNTKRGAGEHHAELEWQALLGQYHGLCAYCWAAKATTREHVLPLSRGGSDTIDNILPVCLSCNTSKQDRTILEWCSSMSGSRVMLRFP